MADEQQGPAVVQEGSRWRYAKPSSDEVAAWFGTQPLDGGMTHADYVSGIVLIPSTEKVKKQVPGKREGTWDTADSWELTHTPYVRVDTRVRYFRALAEERKLISVIEPVEVPRMDAGPFANVHMPDGYWWYVMGGKPSLCCTMRVALFRPEDYWDEEYESNVGPQRRKIRPALFGVSTKMVDPNDANAIAKAETGAIGRALGVAGILVIGTGIATAEDMQEATGAQGIQAVPALPEAGASMETEEEVNEEEVNERCLILQGRLKEDFPEGWTEFAAWWQERVTEEGWKTLTDAPLEVRRGVASRLESLLARGVAEHTVAAPEG